MSIKIIKFYLVFIFICFIVIILRSNNNETRSTDGYATVPNQDIPNKLEVRFPMNVPIINYSFSTAGDYNVWDTDYTNYALVYSCSQYLFIKSEAAWILARGKSLDESLITQLKDKLGANSAKNLIRVYQGCSN